jgi:hypothetical protein
MRSTKIVMSACGAMALCYLAYPYVTLYRLGSALHNGDAATLQALVNWPAVREGIKEDICDAVADNPDASTRKGQLPEFGASFIRGVAANAIDERVTPTGLVAAVNHHGVAPAAGSMAVHWAFFDSPTLFTVSLQGPGRVGPIRMQLELRAAQWQVNRVWLPPQLLDEANQRT